MRPSYEEIAFDIARTIAQRSTCPRLHTGAVITTQDNRVLCTGYNGSLPGTPHCEVKYCRVCKGLYPERYKCTRCNESGIDPEPVQCLIIDGHCKRTVHAEANAITQAARYGIAIAGCKMYALHEPCIDCTQIIVSVGITRVYIANPYRSEETTKYLEQLGCDRNLFVWSTSQAQESQTLTDPQA